MGALDIIKTFLPLVLIVGLLYGVLYFIKKYGITVKGSKSSIVPIKVLNTQMIMPKKYITVVKVEGKLLLLGISENSVSLLKELETDANEITQITPDSKNPSFLEILKQNIGIK